MKKIKNLIDSLHKLKANINLILYHEKGIKKKTIALLTYFKIIGKYFFLVKLAGIKLKKENILGFRVQFPDYSNFLYLFEHVFILKEYKFKAKNTINPFIIDCGSNIGLSTLFFKKKYPNAKIMCFEPDKKTFQILKANIDNNKITNTILNEAAVYDKNGKIKFYLDANLDCSLGMATTPHFIQQWGKETKEIIVNSVKLSTYIAEPVDLLKLDVEGAEEKVINELDKTKKIQLIKEMIIEYHYNKNNTENSLSSILGILEKNNFKFIINCNLRPPYFVYQNKPYYLLIYAYK